MLQNKILKVETVQTTFSNNIAIKLCINNKNWNKKMELLKNLYAVSWITLGTKRKPIPQW